jgi:hypothetical protein
MNSSTRKPFVGRPTKRAVRLTGALALATSILAGTTLTAAPANAAGNANVWLNFSNSYCVGGGTMTGVFGAVDNVWSGGDWGDRVLYPRAQLYRTNTFNGRAYCDRPWYDPRGDYWVNIIWKEFYPTRNGQAFYF